MQAVIGIDKYGKPVTWDPSKLINPHILLTGMSGSGKTTMLKIIINQIIRSTSNNIRIHLVDVHGDIHINGASSLLFSQNMTYGYNPLVIDPDPHSGGVNAAITSFIKLLSKTANYKMGDRQEAVMRSLLLELYERNGFFANNSNSWRLDDGYRRSRPKAYPTVSDAYRFAKNKLEVLFLGGNSKTYAALREVATKQKSIIRVARNANSDVKSLLDDKDFMKAFENLKNSYAEFFDTVEKGNGNEIQDLLKYPKQDMLAGVVDRLEKLHFMGVFSGTTPPFDPNKSVWRYELNKLDREASVLFVHTLAASIFNNCVHRGEVRELTDIIVVDEARRFIDADDDSIFKIIANESRKFGLGLFSSSQSHGHFSSDVIQSSATSIILKQDESNYNKVRSLTNVDQADLAAIIGRKTVLVRMNGNEGVAASYNTITVDTNVVAQKMGLPAISTNDRPVHKRDDNQYLRTENTENSDDYNYASQQQPSRAAPNKVVEREIDVPDITDFDLSNLQQAPQTKQQPMPTSKASTGDPETDTLIDDIFSSDEEVPPAKPIQVNTNQLDVFSLSDIDSSPKPQPAPPVDVLAQLKARQHTEQTSTSAPAGQVASGGASDPSVKKRNLLL